MIIGRNECRKHAVVLRGQVDDRQAGKPFDETRLIGF